MRADRLGPHVSPHARVCVLRSLCWVGLRAQVISFVRAVLRPLIGGAAPSAFVFIPNHAEIAGVRDGFAWPLWLNRSL